MKQLYRYLPLSDEIRSRALYVIAGGSAHLPPGAAYPPSTHPQHHRFDWRQGRVLQEYQVLYLARGSGRLETVAGGERLLQAGDLFVLFPQEWHRYSPDPETGWEEHWIAFQGSQAAALLAEHRVSPADPVFHYDTSDALLREFLRVVEEITEEARGYQTVAAARVQLILALAAACHQRRDFQAADVLEVIKRTKELLRERIDRPTDMQVLAADLHVGYPWLRKMFRYYTGLPLAQYQTQLRLSVASELLRETKLPIAVVGCRSGFESAYYFARVFRNKMGCTPSEYRLQSRSYSVPANQALAWTPLLKEVA